MLYISEHGIQIISTTESKELKTNQVERRRPVRGRVRKWTVLVLLCHRSSGTSNCSKRTVYGSMHGRQIGHKRHIGRVQQLQRWLVVEKPGHPIHQRLTQLCSLGAAAVSREQSHDTASLQEYVKHCLHFLQNGLGTDLHHSHTHPNQ